MRKRLCHLGRIKKYWNATHTKGKYKTIRFCTSICGFPEEICPTVRFWGNEKISFRVKFRWKLDVLTGHYRHFLLGAVRRNAMLPPKSNMVSSTRTSHRTRPLIKLLPGYATFCMLKRLYTAARLTLKSPTTVQMATADMGHDHGVVAKIKHVIMEWDTYPHSSIDGHKTEL
jgi:hypothetical protein